MSATPEIAEASAETAWIEFNDLFALFDITSDDLVELTGLSKSTISSMRNGNPDGYKTSQAVAVGIVNAINELFGVPAKPVLQLQEVNWPRGLSHLGRPPLSGGTSTGPIPVFSDRRCNDCFLILPVAADKCDCTA